MVRAMWTPPLHQMLSPNPRPSPLSQHAVNTADRRVPVAETLLVYPSAECRVQSLLEGRIAEGLKEAFHGAQFHQPRPDGAIPVRCNKDDWNPLSAPCEL